MLLSREVLYYYITNHTIVATNYQRESNGILYLELDSLFAYNEFSGSFFVRINGEKAEILEKGSRTVTVTCTFSSCPVSGKTGDCTWQYDQQTRKLTISGSGKMSDYDENEEAPWYPYRDRIRDVVIESGVTHIGAWSFYNTGAPIFRVNIPDSVEEIGSVAFYYCTTLSKAELGSGVKIIGQKAFYATNLSTVTIPENVTYIGGMAFGFHTGEKKDTSFIIRGKSGTAAEFYADDNSFIFKPISYDVWLAGTQITVDNIDILTPVIAQNSSEAKERFKNGEMEITFDGKSTLILKNAIIDTGTKTAQGATFGIKGLNIVVEGDCRIIGREVNGIKLTQNATITGGGTLTVTGKSSGISYDGDGDIELTVDKTALNVSGSIGINGGSSPSGKKLTINCSDVTAEGSNSAINYLGEITLNDAEIITPKGGEIKSSATWDGSPSLGIYDGSTLSKKAVIAAKPNAQTMIGDVNGDGNVTIDDATLVQKAIAELIELDDTQKKAADTNSDEKITIDDATMIQKYIAELIDHLG